MSSHLPFLYALLDQRRVDVLTRVSVQIKIASTKSSFVQKKHPPSKIEGCQPTLNDNWELEALFVISIVQFLGDAGIPFF